MVIMLVYPGCDRVLGYLIVLLKRGSYALGVLCERYGGLQGLLYFDHLLSSDL